MLPNRLLRSLLALLALGLLAACETVEETRRSQFVLPFLTDGFMAELGAEAYAEETANYRVLTTTREADMLARVGRRIAQASGRDYQWEFKLLDAPDVVNAFCLPGGKIAFYTGILPICANEDGIAIVMGHEVAHATSRHGAERMSQGLVAELLMAGAAAGLEETKWSDETKGLVLGALGLAGTLAVLLPYSRDHETEADEIGLRFAIRAGYDPNEAPRLWERMAKLGDGGPEFLSTHPDPLKRAERLRELIPRLVAEEKARAEQPAR
ncbi:MAG: M48 family metallopeptidase [Planctomycetes bacterium]|nr:M48 family metallopeptidase [Planctomycetota bacterium]